MTGHIFACGRTGAANQLTYINVCLASAPSHGCQMVSSQEQQQRRRQTSLHVSAVGWTVGMNEPRSTFYFSQQKDFFFFNILNQFTKIKIEMRLGWVDFHWRGSNRQWLRRWWETTTKPLLWIFQLINHCSIVSNNSKAKRGWDSPWPFCPRWVFELEDLPISSWNAHT